MTYSLHQIVGTLDPWEQEKLRIRLDGRDFDYGSDEYITHQHAKVEEYELRKNPDTLLPMLVCSTKKRPEE